jgi:hypothetical protein
MFDEDLTVDEGDKIEIEGEDKVHVITSIVVSVKAEPADNGIGFSDRIKFGKEELEQKIESGEVKVLSETDPVTDAGREIGEHVDIEQLIDDLEGRNGLRTSKPDADGLTQYVWRMARFHGGYDDSMPVMIHGALQDYLDENGIDASVTGVMDDAGKEVRSELEKAVDAVLVGYSENPAMAAQRWEKAGAF